MKTTAWRAMSMAFRQKGRTRIGLVLVTLLALALGVLGAGPASASSAKTTVCHRNGNGTFQEISVASSAVRAHLAQGDTVGPCRPPDRTRPTITVTTPASGGVYAVGQRVEADYECADEEGGSGIALCVGSVGDGSPINTAAGGSRLRLFLVLAVDNAGNVNLVLRTYTLQADATAPTVTLTNPVDGRSYDQGAEVLAEYACADETGGSGLASCAGPAASGAAIDTATLGEHEFTVTARDNAGNETVVTHAYTVTNGSDPVITVTTPSLEDGIPRYVVGETVLADYSCAAQPGGAAIVSCTGNIADGDPLDTSQWRAPAYLVVDATDNAGRSTRSIIPYIVLRADEIAPQVSILSPNDLDVYAQGAEVVADFGCEDTGNSQTNVSGVATCEGTVPSGGLIDTAALGEHEFTVTATDNAGNETVVTHTYTVESSLRDCGGVELVSGADLSNCDLAGLDLYGVDLSFADLRGADLRGAYLTLADLSFADLRGADLSLSDLTRADLRGADLRGADLTDAGFALTACPNGASSRRENPGCASVDGVGIDLTTPQDEASFGQGESVEADFRCFKDPRNEALTFTCAAESASRDGQLRRTVVAGELIDTSTLGGYDFTVTATDNAGNETVITSIYWVV